jgi:hypothetical protein
MMIRKATPADKPRLIEMAVRFLLESPYGALFDNQATPDAIGTLVDNVISLGVIIVAEVDRGGGLFGSKPDPKLVGMLAAVALPHPLTGKTCAEEMAWWVEPEHRGGLLGPKMLRVFEEWATRNGANMVKMVAPAGSTVGTFYEHIGYQAVETAFIKRI